MFRSLALAVLSLSLFSLSPAGASTMSNHYAYAGDHPVRVAPSNRQAELVGVLPGHVIHGLDDWEFHVVTLRGLRTRLPGVCSWSPALALTYLIETTVFARETLVLSSFDGIGRDGVGARARGGSGFSAMRFGGGGSGKGSTPTTILSPVPPTTGTPGTENGGNDGNGDNTVGSSPLDTILGEIAPFDSLPGPSTDPDDTDTSVPPPVVAGQVPLPAGGLLLASAIGALLVGLRRRRVA